MMSLLSLWIASARAEIDPACIDAVQPDDYDEQAQADFQANYFALSTSYSPVHGPIPHEPGHGHIGIDARIIPPLACERRFVLDWTKTEQTNKSPILPTLTASYAFPAIKDVLVPYAGFSILPAIPLGDPDNVKSDEKLPVCDGTLPLTECRRRVRTMVVSGELGLGIKAYKTFEVGVRGHATMMRTYGDIATAFDEAEEPSVEDIYAASTWGFDAQLGVGIPFGKQRITPFVTVGYLNASTFFFIGDDAFAANNLHPYSGAAFSVGADGLIQGRIRLGGEFYGAPGGFSLPNPDAEVAEGAGRYGRIYTARFRIGIEI